MLFFVLFVLTPVILGLSQPEQPSPNPGSSVASSQSSAAASASSNGESAIATASASANSLASSNNGGGCQCARRCKPTCSTPNPKNCKPNENCKCKKGSVWSNDGRRCIPVSECSKDLGCNGDPNAFISENPPPCPSTCEFPDQSNCKKLGLNIGCVCKGGDILLKEGGKCINPNDCPGGNPCRGNQTFSYCKSECPTNFCPVDDSQGIIACDPIWPCPSGCICERGYKRKSYDDPQCILPQECPPVNCTRPNEEWDSCPSPCFSDGCSDAFRDKSICYTLVAVECNPQCVCKKNFARNVEGVCIPINQCPKET